MRRLVLAACALALALPVVARADDWDHEYPITRATRLRLVTGDGKVYIQPGKPGVVRLHVHTNGLSIGHAVLIDIRNLGDSWTAEVRERKHWFSFTIDFHPRVIVDLIVPPQCQLAVSTGDGGIEAERVAGDLSLHTGDGGIRAHELRGNVKLDTGDGGVEADGLDGTISAHSGDGGVRLAGRFDRLDVSSGDGGLTLTAQSGSRVAEDWNVETGDGGVRLRLPQDLHADLDAHTGDGGIVVDMPVEISGVMKRSAVQGRLNGGGGTIRLRSGDGSIHIAAS